MGIIFAGQPTEKFYRKRSWQMRGKEEKVSEQANRKMTVEFGLVMLEKRNCCSEGEGHVM